MKKNSPVEELVRVLKKISPEVGDITEGAILRDQREELEEIVSQILQDQYERRVEGERAKSYFRGINDGKIQARESLERVWNPGTRRPRKAGEYLGRWGNMVCIVTYHPSGWSLPVDYWAEILPVTDKTIIGL